MESAAFNGDFTKNLFNFHDFKMSSITLTVNDEAIPFKLIKLSFGAIQGLSKHSAPREVLYDYSK